MPNTTTLGNGRFYQGSERGGSKDLDAILMLNIYSGDLAVVKVKLTNETGTIIWMAVALPYLPYDAAEPSPPQEVRTLEDYCARHKLLFIFRCDSNVYYTVWGSTNMKIRESTVKISSYDKPEHFKQRDNMGGGILNEPSLALSDHM